MNTDGSALWHNIKSNIRLKGRHKTSTVQYRGREFDTRKKRVSKKVEERERTEATQVTE